MSDLKKKIRLLCKEAKKKLPDKKLTSDEIIYTALTDLYCQDYTVMERQLHFSGVSEDSGCTEDGFKFVPAEDRDYIGVN